MDLWILIWNLCQDTSWIRFFSWNDATYIMNFDLFLMEEIILEIISELRNIVQNEESISNTYVRGEIQPKNTVDY